jgi:predicted HTH domain antitoxin
VYSVLENNDNSSFQIINEEERRKIVIEYVSANLGCTAEDIVNNITSIGRIKIFRILKELKKEGIVIHQTDLTDKRKIKLFINTSNYLIIVSNELEQIREYLNILTNYTFDIIVKNMPPKSVNFMSPTFYGIRLFPLFAILDYISSMYNRKSIEWFQKIRDKESLNRIYIHTFSQIAIFRKDVLNRIIKTFNKDPELTTEIVEIASINPESSLQLRELVIDIDQNKMLKETKQILKYLQKISGDSPSPLLSRRQKRLKISDLDDLAS